MPPVPEPTAAPISAAVARQLLQRVASGHTLDKDEAAQFVILFEELLSSPDRQLLALVAGIGANAATAYERADQAHQLMRDALGRIEAWEDRVGPLHVELASAEVARRAAEAELFRANAAKAAAEAGRAGRWTEQVHSVLLAALNNRGVTALLVVAAAAIAVALGVKWTG